MLHVKFHASVHVPVASQMPSIIAYPVQSKGFVYGTVYTGQPVPSGKVETQLRAQVRQVSAICAEVLHHLNGVCWLEYLRTHSLTAAVTAREREILVILSTGMKRREAAACLVIQYSTLKKHLEHVYGKLDAHDLTQALANGYRAGLFSHLM